MKYILQCNHVQYNCCSAIVAMHLLQCSCFRAIVAVQLLQCTRCSAIVAVHLFQGNCCSVIVAMHSLQCNFFTAITGPIVTHHTFKSSCRSYRKSICKFPSFHPIVKIVLLYLLPRSWLIVEASSLCSECFNRRVVAQKKGNKVLEGGGEDVKGD